MPSQSCEWDVGGLQLWKFMTRAERDIHSIFTTEGFTTVVTDEA